VTVLVDTSVWIDYLRGKRGPLRDRFVSLLRVEEVATTDAVVLEVLAGPTAEQHAERLSRMLSGVVHLRQQSPDDAETAAALYRACRRAGEAPRSMLDCLVAAVAVRAGVPVLHRDRDFDVLARHTDLRVVTP
jgi:predicted nucleic acid-binding protein